MKRNLLAFRTQPLGDCFQSLHRQPLRAEKSPGIPGLKRDQGSLRGMLIPGPGTLDITGLEPRNPFPLAQMVELRAWPFAGW